MQIYLYRYLMQVSIQVVCVDFANKSHPRIEAERGRCLHTLYKQVKCYLVGFTRDYMGEAQKAYLCAFLTAKIKTILFFGY